MSKFNNKVVIVDENGETRKWDFYIGSFPIRQDIVVLPADEPRKLKLGWTIKEVIGKAVVMRSK